MDFYGTSVIVSGDTVSLGHFSCFVCNKIWMHLEKQMLETLEKNLLREC